MGPGTDGGHEGPKQAERHYGNGPLQHGVKDKRPQAAPRDHGAP
jgi:hypothetical protein